ncbi:MAG TPA: hypothetical protein DC049_06200, partial [Spirochaetia bacterium]|nr:hypothetical protein [Spirochaetia bacterium]
MRKTSIVRTLISLAVLFSGMVWSQEWKQLPMRTKAQKAAGLMGGDGAQQVMDIAYAPSNPKIAYLVADTCQVWKSIDSGFSWKLCNKGFNTEGGFSIVIDPNNEKIVFAAGCIGRGLRHGTENTALSGIYRTTNDGQSWRMVKQVLFLGRNSDGKHQGKYFAFDKSSFDGKRTKIIYAGTYEEGFYKTTDGGDNWTETGGFKGKQIYDVKINPKDKRILYLATSEGLFIYNDINQEKSRIGDNLPSFPRTIAINSVNPEIIYAAAGFQGIYWSQDGGKSFKERNKGLPLSEEKAAMRKEYIYVSLSPVNPDYIYASCGSDSIGTFYSHNGGAEWGVPGLDPELLTIGAERGATRFFAGQIDPHPLDANKALMLANGTAGVMKTDDGGKIWNYSSDGYTGTRTGYKGIAFYNDPQKMMFFVLDHGPYCTVDGGDTFQWVSVPRRSTHSTPAGAVEPAEGKTIAAAVGAWGRGDFRQALIVSEDGGQTWEMKNDVVDLFFFIAFHPQNPNVIYAQGYRSDDKGRT